MVAVRPREASTIQATDKVIASIIRAAIKRGELPWKICASAREIKAGWRVRNSNRSREVTGRESRYSIPDNMSSKAAAKPKLQRQAISAKLTDGRENMMRKPAKVGERPGIGIEYRTSCVNS